MKKYLLGIIAIVFAIGLSSFSNTLKKHHAQSNEDLLYWYPVNPVTSETSDSYQTHDYKANVKNQICDDDLDQPICFFGSTDDDVTIGTDVSTAMPANLVRQTE